MALILPSRCMCSFIDIDPQNMLKNEMNKVHFIHITKTAGTSIEETLKQIGVEVGVFDRRFPKTKKGAHWHLPLSERSPEEIEALKNEESFAVIRNPMNRAISEYNCQWGNQIAQSQDKRVINYVIIKHILEAVGLIGKTAPAGHWIPQWEFIVLNNERIIGDLLVFEDLKQDWYDFAIKRGFPQRLIHKNAGEKLASKADLFMVTKLLVRIVYRRDYRLWKVAKEIKKSRRT